MICTCTYAFISTQRFQRNGKSVQWSLWTDGGRALHFAAPDFNPNKSVPLHCCRVPRYKQVALHKLKKLTQNRIAARLPCFCGQPNAMRAEATQIPGVISNARLQCTRGRTSDVCVWGETILPIHDAARLQCFCGRPLAACVVWARQGDAFYCTAAMLLWSTQRYVCGMKNGPSSVYYMAAMLLRPS